MLYVNHTLQAIFIQLPKCGGSYVRDILIKYYNFQEFEIEKRDDIFDFFDVEEHLINSIEFYKGNIATIRKLGILRFMLTNEDNNISQNMTEEKWNSYYKFTFVRNPYERLVSSYEMFKQIGNKIPDNNTTKYASFEEFIDNKEKIGNVPYFHSFITMTSQLLDYNESLNINFVGEFSSLDKDLITVLKQIGIKYMKHLAVEDDCNIKWHNNNIHTNFHNYYNNSILKKVNLLFVEDFKHFKYKKFNRIKRMAANYTTASQVANIPLIELYKNTQLMNIQENLSLYNLCELKKELYSFISNIKIIYSIENDNTFINTSIHNMNNILNNQITLFSEKNMPTYTENISRILEKDISLFNRSKCKKICQKCKLFESYNNLSLHGHKCKCAV